MQHYIIKEEDTLYLLEYSTDKPKFEDFEYCDDAEYDYHKAMQKWKDSEIKIPFHDKDKAYDLVLYMQNKNPVDLRKLWDEGILIYNGLAYKNGNFGFVKDYEQIEKINEAYLWDEVCKILGLNNPIIDGLSVLKEKFLIKRK